MGRRRRQDVQQVGRVPLLLCLLPHPPPVRTPQVVDAVMTEGSLGGRVNHIVEYLLQYSFTVSITVPIYC